jgi:hypothetical protein
MKRSPLVYLSLLTLMIVLLAALERPARAQATAGAVSAGGSGGAGIGVGASAFVSGLTGADVVYDAARWHIEGLLAFSTSHRGNPNGPRFTTFNFGVSGWYHLHLGASSDFSLGGGVGIVNQSGGGLSNVSEVLEPGAQIRAFVTPNVAVHAMIAFTIVLGDDVAAQETLPGRNTSFGFDSQVLAGFGFTYFFR